MKHLLACIVVLLWVVIPGHSQTFRGSINGAVTDQTGAALAGAVVKATDTGTGIVLTTVTTAEGQFSFQDLPPGAYQVAVTASGFTPVTVDKIPVTAGAIYTLPVTLRVGQQATAVEVSAAAITVDTTTVTQSDTIPDAALQDIPMNGRDFSQLIAVAPGYGGYAVGGFGSLNGTRANQMNWQIDGTDNNDFWHNIPAVNQGGVSGIAGVVMPMDAIDEFSAQTQSNAESGRNAGGTVNLTIKSGTNELHGSAYYYNRNEFYAAHSPFFVPTPDFPRAPPLRNYNYGLSVGAPIIKDKTFFFGAFEKQDYIFGLTGLSTEPSTAFVQQAEAQLATAGTPTNPLSLKLLATLWPSSILNLPATSNNYFATVPGTGYSYNGVVKVDHNFNAKNHLSLHWFAGEGSQTQPPGASLALATASSNLGYYFEVAPIHVQNYSAVLNSVLTERAANQLLFGVSYFNQVFHDSNNSFDSQALGLFTSPDATIHGNPIPGAPNIQIAGFDQVGITPPEGRNDATGHLTDIFSYVKGKHQFRFGAEVRQGRVDEFYHRRSLGSFSFNSLEDFLAGNVASADIAVGDPERFVRVNGIDFFAQDNWQVTRNLNVNLGLRWDYMGPLHSPNQDLAVFIPGQGLKIQGNGINSIFPSDKNNFGPRLGFAYQPTSKNDFVVRGGIGVFYDQINMNPFLDYRGNGADGLQDNPIGPKPVDNYAINTPFTWQSNQYIFPGITACPTLSGCGSNLYNVYSVNQDFRTPYFFNYSLNVEKAFGNAVVWQVGYVGSLGRKTSVMLNINQNGAFDAEYPNIGSVYQLNSIGNSNYNALQSTLKIRSWHGVTGQFAFTWAHALDDVTEYRGVVPLDSYNLAQEYGSSDFDTRLNFTTFLTYDIPGSAHGPKWLSHGWQLSSLFSFHSGQPFNFDAGTQRPGLDILGNPFSGVSHTFIPGVGEQWVNPAMFCVPGAAGCAGPTDPNGDLSRNLFRGPGFADVDLSVIKNISFGERFKLQLRAEMFNVFNHKNLASGAGSVGSNGFVGDTIGDFNGAPGLGPGEPFNMQLVGKIIF
ncbi:MAG: carboxypeptidase regulatory-like domain-containing protein [Bryobacteraceae bacterium]